MIFTLNFCDNTWLFSIFTQGVNNSKKKLKNKHETVTYVTTESIKNSLNRNKVITN